MPEEETVTADTMMNQPPAGVPMPPSPAVPAFEKPRQGSTVRHCMHAGCLAKQQQQQHYQAARAIAFMRDSSNVAYSHVENDDTRTACARSIPSQTPALAVREAAHWQAPQLTEHIGHLRKQKRRPGTSW